MVRRLFTEVWNKRKLAVIDEIIAAGHLSHDPSTPNVGTVPEGYRQLVNLYTSAIPDTHFKIEGMVAEGNLVTTRWTVQGTHQAELKGIAPTGNHITVTGMTVSRISRGRIVESWNNWDALGMMEQLEAVRVAAQTAV